MHLIIISLETIRSTAASVLERMLSLTCVAASLLFTFFDSLVFHGSYAELMLITAAVVLDTLLGILSAWHTSALRSRDLFRVVPKLLTYFAMYTGALLVDATLPEQVRLASAFTAFFIVSTEVLSLFEHAALLGFKTPSGLISRLRVMRDSGELPPRP